jgi:ERCC4-type nuclease
MIPSLPSKFCADYVTVIIDTREQKPVDVSPLKSVRGTLVTADYSIKGLEDHVAIERKSKQDLIQSVGRERDRFDRVVHRLQAYETKAIVVEATWEDLKAGLWRGSVTSSQVCGSVLGWMAAGVPVLLAGNAERAGDAIARMLYIAARRRYGIIRSMIQGV